MAFLSRIQSRNRKPNILLIILVVSVFLRVIPVLILGNAVVELPGTYDQISYHALAQRVISGYGFTFAQNWWPATRAGEPTAHWSFLYTLYLAACYALFGVNPIIPRLIQVVVTGILHPYLVYKIGKELVGQETATIAAGLTAVYAYFVYYTSTLMTEPFYITAILAAIYLSIQMTSSNIGDRRKAWLAAGLGALLGITVLFRQLFLLFIPFMLVWIGWRERKQKRLLLLTEIMLPILILCLMILPFTLYNYQRFGQFVLLNTNSGYAFFFGNHPIYGTHFVPILPPEMGTYQDLIPKELLPLSEAALDQALLKRAIQFILADPLRYTLLSISRVPAYFQFWLSEKSTIVSNLSRLVSFGILWPFMLYGLIRWGISGGFRRFSSPAWLLVLFMVIYTGIHLLSWALIRYRLPVDAVLLLFASVAMMDLYHAILKFRKVKLHPAKS